MNKMHVYLTIINFVQYKKFNNKIIRFFILLILFKLKNNYVYKVVRP